MIIILLFEKKSVLLYCLHIASTVRSARPVPLQQAASHHKRKQDALSVRSSQMSDSCLVNEKEREAESSTPTTRGLLGGTWQSRGSGNRQCFS